MWGVKLTLFSVHIGNIQTWSVIDCNVGKINELFCAEKTNQALLPLKKDLKVAAFKNILKARNKLL